MHRSPPPPRALRVLLEHSSSVTGSASRSCVPCSPGTYGISAGASACVPCSAGSYYPTSGSTSVSACVSCPAGTYSALSGTASPSVYQACSLGRILQRLVHRRAACAQRALRPRLWAPRQHRPACLCSPGTYQSTPGSAACVTCVRGSYSNATGTTSSAVCQPVPAGSYADATSVSAPLPCAPGCYSNAPGSTGCSLCSPGSYSSSANSTCRHRTASMTWRHGHSGTSRLHRERPFTTPHRR